MKHSVVEVAQRVNVSNNKQMKSWLDYNDSRKDNSFTSDVSTRRHCSENTAQ